MSRRWVLVVTVTVTVTVTVIGMGLTAGASEAAPSKKPAPITKTYKVSLLPDDSSHLMAGCASVVAAAQHTQKVTIPAKGDLMSISESETVTESTSTRARARSRSRSGCAPSSALRAARSPTPSRTPDLVLHGRTPVPWRGLAS